MATTANGLTYPGLGDAPNGPGQIQQLATDVDAVYGSNVANAGALPAAGKFLGQRIWLIDVKGWAVWDGTTWRSDLAPTAVSFGTGWGIFGSEACTAERVAGMVTVYVSATKTAASTAGEIVFTLPTGFRPKRPVHALCNNAGSGRAVTVAIDGKVSNDVAQSAGLAAMLGVINFPAA